MKKAVLIPCYNEEQTIAEVVSDFKKALPDAEIYVFDNASTDNSAERARQSGAIVRPVSKRGKGNVVREMFRYINADIYVLADADLTYPAEQVHDLIAPIIDGTADMVVGDRHSNQSYARENKRAFHGLGNWMVKLIINILFKSKLTDIMSGYRAFNRVFVKTIPILSKGFEVETEMTLHALDKNMSICEIPVIYKDRPHGSTSKLNTVADGFRVLKTIMWVFKDYKPLVFFGFISLVSFIIGAVVGFFPVYEYFTMHYVYKVPSAILATGCMIFSVLFFTIGLILETNVRIDRANYELKVTEWISRDRYGKD